MKKTMNKNTFIAGMLLTTIASIGAQAYSGHSERAMLEQFYTAPRPALKYSELRTEIQVLQLKQSILENLVIAEQANLISKEGLLSVAQRADRLTRLLTLIAPNNIEAKKNLLSLEALARGLSAAPVSAKNTAMIELIRASSTDVLSLKVEDQVAIVLSASSSSAVSRALAVAKIEPSSLINTMKSLANDNSRNSKSWLNALSDTLEDLIVDGMDVDSATLSAQARREAIQGLGESLAKSEGSSSWGSVAQIGWNRIVEGVNNQRANLNEIDTRTSAREIARIIRKTESGAVKTEGPGEDAAKASRERQKYQRRY